MWKWRLRGALSCPRLQRETGLCRHRHTHHQAKRGQNCWRDKKTGQERSRLMKLSAVFMRVRGCAGSMRDWKGRQESLGTNGSRYGRYYRRMIRPTCPCCWGPWCSIKNRQLIVLCTLLLSLATNPKSQFLYLWKINQDNICVEVEIGRRFFWRWQYREYAWEMEWLRIPLGR